MFNGVQIPNVGLNAVAGRPKEEYGVDPTAFDEMRPGCFDVHERVKDMNAGGVLACMNFPSFPAFSGRLFAACDDKDLALAVTQAYNDWHDRRLVRGRTPSGSSRWRSPSSGIPSCAPPRSGASRPRAATR